MTRPDVGPRRPLLAVGVVTNRTRSASPVRGLLETPPRRRHQAAEPVVDLSVAGPDEIPSGSETSARGCARQPPAARVLPDDVRIPVTRLLVRGRESRSPAWVATAPPAASAICRKSCRSGPRLGDWRKVAARRQRVFIASASTSMSAAKRCRPKLPSQSDSNRPQRFNRCNALELALEAAQLDMRAAASSSEHVVTAQFACCLR